MNRRKAGSMGEAAACAFLEKNGWKIEGRNVHRGGCEVDIIARKGAILSFVEVKSRMSDLYGRPAEAVDAAKQRHIARVAALYLQERGDDDNIVRFDVIEVTPEGIRHIEAAFDTPERY